MCLVVLGLGNIGRRYELSRHNLGFRVVQTILNREGLSLKPAAVEYDWAEKTGGSSRIVFAMPRTYMNLSGSAASALLQKYDLDPSRLVVVTDDFNLPLGKIRIRVSGSDGGHNGLASIIEELQTECFPRIRLGIGPVPDKESIVDFVLGDFDNEEIEPTKKMIDAASDAVLCFLEHGVDKAMTEYNTNNPA